MAKIRQKFLKGGLSIYDRKKYVWKLIYAHILGYDVDFGHDIAISLINCPKFFDKSTGYISIGIMLNEKSDFTLFVNCIDTIKSDLNCGNEVFESLAIATLGNIGSANCAKELAPVIVQKALTDDKKTTPYIKKKACACLMSFLRRQPSIYHEEAFKAGFSTILRSTNFGLLLSACSLLYVTIQLVGPEAYSPALQQLVFVLENIKEHANNYYYYMTPCPWLQVKILQIMQLFPPSTFHKLNLLHKMETVVKKIFSDVTITKNVNKNNADHSTLFESINLVLSFGELGST